MKHLIQLATFLMAYLFSATLFAHGVGTSYLHVEQRADTAALQVRVDLSLRDLEFSIGLDSDHDARITWSEVLNAQAALASYIAERLHIRRGDQPCAFGASELMIDQHADGPYAVLSMPLTCPTTGALALQSDLLFDIDDSHRSLLNIDTDSMHIVTVLTSDTRTWTATATNAGHWSAFARFVEQGVWHIWTGFDHLAFLMLLLLPLARPSSIQTPTARWTAVVGGVLRVVTAFTVAHSITLACAAFDYVHLPSRWVEAAIAASIVIAGIVNLLPRASRYGVAMAFGFGLIHGLGFASALAAITANSASRLLPLLGFNLGVEVGQLAVVSAVFPLLFLNKASPLFKRRAVAAGSLCISAMGMVWLVQRTLLS
jgi:hypothetical protein